MKTRPKVVVLAVIVIAALAVMGHLQAAAPLSPSGGKISIRGEASAQDVMRLDISVEPLVSSVFSLGAVKVYAEPSHTLLAALVDAAKLGAGGLAAVSSERPLSTLRADLSRPVSPSISIKFANRSDSGIRFDYELIASDGSRVSHTVREASVGSLARFGITSGPRLGGVTDEYHCWCNETECQDPIECPGTRVTVCCLAVPCWCACGTVPCVTLPTVARR
jgi:hypothetical protein